MLVLETVCPNECITCMIFFYLQYKENLLLFYICQGSKVLLETSFTIIMWFLCREAFLDTNELMSAVETFGYIIAACESSFLTLTSINRSQRLHDRMTWYFFSNVLQLVYTWAIGFPITLTVLIFASNNNFFALFIYFNFKKDVHLNIWCFIYACVKESGVN